MSVPNLTKGLAVAAALLAGTALPGVAPAAVTLASDAAAVRVRAGALDLVSADAQVGRSAGTAPAAYNLSSGAGATLNQQATLSGTVAAGLGERVTADAVTTHAAANGTTAASADTTLTNARLSAGATALGLFGTPLLSDLFGLAATTIGSTSSVALVGGQLVATGTSQLAGLQFTGALAGTLGGLASLAHLDLAALAAPAANTRYVLGTPLTGTLTLTFNEQLLTGDGVTGRGIETNAVDLAFDNFALGGRTLTGQVVLGHSAASLAGAVPEPATWATMVAGFALAGAALRGSRRSASVLA
jgi:hypothetical protein